MPVVDGAEQMVAALLVVIEVGPVIVGLIEGYLGGGCAILVQHMGHLIDIQVDIRAQAVLVVVGVLPLLVPEHRLGAGEPVGDRHGLDVAVTVFVHLVLFIGIAGGIGPDQRIGIGEFLGEFGAAEFPAAAVHPDFHGGVVDYLTAAVVFGQVVEGILPGAVLGFQADNLQRRSRLAVLVADSHLVIGVADGDGVGLAEAVPGDLIVILSPDKVQTDRQIELAGGVGIRPGLFQLGEEFFPHTAFTVQPLLGDGEVDVAQTPVGDGEKLGAGDGIPGIGGLIPVVLGFILNGGIGAVRVVFRRSLGLGVVGGGAAVQIVGGQRDGFVPHPGFQDIDLIGCIAADADIAIPHAVLQGNRGDCLVILLGIGLDGHRQTVGGITVIDPHLAHHDAVAGAGGYIDDPGLVAAVLGAFGFIDGEAGNPVALFQQVVFILATGAVEFGQIPDLSLPGFSLLDGDAQIGIHHRGSRIGNAVQGDLHIGIGVKGFAGQSLEDLQGDSLPGRSLHGLSLFVLPVLGHLVVDGVVQGIGDEGAAAVLLYRGGLIVHRVAVLPEGEGAVVPEEVFLALPLVDTAFHPAVFQFPAQHVILGHRLAADLGELFGIEFVHGHSGQTGIFPGLIAVLGTGLEFQFHPDIFQFRLEGSSVPGLGDPGGDIGVNAVGEGAAVIEIGVARGAFPLGIGLHFAAEIHCIQQGAVRLHRTEYLFIVIGSGKGLGHFHNAVDVFIAFGVILGKQGAICLPIAVEVHSKADVLPGHAGFIRLGIGIHLHFHQGAESIPERGRRTEILFLAVPPQLEGAAGTGFNGLLVAAVHPDLVGLVFSAAGEGQLEGTARIEGVLNGAEVGHIGVIIGDGEVILSHILQRKTPGGRTAFRLGKLIHLIGDE